jgi:hypothetical protein
MSVATCAGKCCPVETKNKPGGLPCSTDVLVSGGEPEDRLSRMAQLRAVIEHERSEFVRWILACFTLGDIQCVF